MSRASGVEAFLETNELKWDGPNNNWKNDNEDVVMWRLIEGEDDTGRWVWTASGETSLRPSPSPAPHTADGQKKMTKLFENDDLMAKPPSGDHCEWVDFDETSFENIENNIGQEPTPYSTDLCGVASPTREYVS